MEASDGLSRRVELWASRMGATGIGVAVRDFGYRWGSTNSESYINIHWAALQLAPSLIDYVIVHELAHVKALNQTDLYWAEVERAMLGYERRRGELLTAGTRVWACHG
jgi:predicted metal-dependent hydrolase